MQNGTKKAELMPRGRGRPRAYDAEAAMGQLIDTFWNKGYQGASLDDLSSATGMNRPSLYAAFGDKKAMYLRALAAVRASVSAKLDAILVQKQALPKSLLDFYMAALPIYLSGDAAQRGCFVVCTASVEAPNDCDVRLALGAMLDDIDGKFAQVFSGDARPNAAARAKGQLAAAILHSLAVRARAGQSAKSLEKLVRDAVEALT